MSTNARLEELKRKFEENPRRYFAPLANEYRKQGDLTQAITICRAHLPNQPGHISGHIVLAQALYESRELPESRQIFEQALELDPENLIALRSLGDIARAQGEAAAARSWYLRVLDADPRNEEIAGLLREVAAEEAALENNVYNNAQSPSSSFAPPESVAPTVEPALTSAPEEVFDPDKTPVANIAIPETTNPYAMHSFYASTESDDVFGNGVVDQGAELFDAMDDASTAMPEVPAENLADESAEQRLFDTSSTELGEAPVAQVSEPEPPGAEAPPEFVEDSNAFAVAQQLSDPEASPEPMTDDWFNAPTPPRGVLQLNVAPPEPEPLPESLIVPAPSSGSDSAGTRVELDTFDLIEGDEDSVPAPQSADPEEHPASWFAAPTGVDAADVEATTDSSSVAEPAGEVIQGESDWGAGFDESSLHVESYAPETAGPATVDEAVELPPEVELALEPESLPIDRGFVGSEVEVDEEVDVPASAAAFGMADPAVGRIAPDMVPDAATPQMFVTETMAELYLQQGFVDEALQIYRKLLEQHPEDSGLRSRIEALESGASSSLREAASLAPAVDRYGQSARTFFGRVAAHRPVPRARPDSALDLSSLGAQLASRQTLTEGAEGAVRQPSSTLTDLFASAPDAPVDDAAATNLASAFAPEASGRPTRAADSELSLDHLFRDVPPESSSAVTLDAFFAASGGESSTHGSPSAGANEPAGDIEQFTAWLEGLKKK